MIDRLVEQHGNDIQRQLFAAGRLAEKDLRDLVRQVLFRPLDDFERFKRLEPHHARHTRDCRGAADAVVEFKTDDDYRGDVSEEQWTSYLDLVKKAHPIGRLLDHGDFIGTRIRAHLVECTACGAQRTRLSAMVAIRYCGLALSREYAL